MKTKTIITELTQEDLVNLLCTATYGSNWLACSAPDRSNIVVDEKDCREDIWAKCLLAGGKIECTDYNADEGEHYGTLEHYTEEDGQTTYVVSLQDIINGLQNCADGTFKRTPDNYGEDDLAFVTESWRNYRTNHGEMDYPQADALMQIILFGELIYG